jgi:hypothetical protein
MDYTVLILTHIDKKTNKVLLPHLDWLLKSNPEIDYRIIVGEDSIYGKNYNWRNSDQVLRRWWKENASSVKNDNIAVIEWDTLICCELPQISEDYDLVGAMKFEENIKIRGKWKPMRMKDPRWTQDNWMWWTEVPKLNLKQEKKAVGLISFGAMFMKKQVLNNFCLPCWNDVCSENILSELRFPTLASICGFKIGEINLPFVSWTDVTVGKQKGIYHSVDYPISLDYFLD